ncbi:MAG: ABC transporter ATP-binding protein [Lentisphaeria bacterium]|nr:ABC transporter ATP-binding protein [Lentisphaeria bacterium]
MPLLDVRNLTVRFHARGGVVHAVENVSFVLDHGETLGIVGESGSGKSVTCQSLLRLLPEPPARIEQGEARLEGVNLLSLPARELRRVRGRRISVIFQDPMTALNPYLRVSAQLIEPLRLHLALTRREARECAVAALREVGMSEPEARMHNYPHELSGGMRQRVMIAMALATRPDILIADEPTTALDVTVQAQILELIGNLQRKHGTAVILITHDLGVVAGRCNRVAVMYAGRIVEIGETAAVYRQPRHPYTEALKRAIPSLEGGTEELASIPGEPPDPTQPVQGCPFQPRCRHASAICGEPCALRDVAPGHATSCVRVQRGEL